MDDVSISLQSVRWICFRPRIGKIQRDYRIEGACGSNGVFVFVAWKEIWRGDNREDGKQSLLEESTCTLDIDIPARKARRVPFSPKSYPFAPSAI